MADRLHNDDLSHLEATLLDARYRLEGCLAHPRGIAMFRGVEVSSGRGVTIEVVAPEPSPVTGLERFRGSRLLGELQHDALLDVVDVGVTETGLRYAAMAPASGEVLAARLSRTQRLRASDAAEIAAAIALALDGIHVAGTVHGNLHPARVFVTDDGGRTRVQLALGIPRPSAIDIDHDENARALSRQHPEVPWTELARAVVSPIEYCAPEVLLGRQVDARSDVYSLAALLYEMLTGAAPHHCSTPARIIVNRLVGMPAELITRVPTRLAGEVMRALSRAPSDRHPSAAAFAVAISAAIASSSTMPPPASAAPPTRAPELRAAAPAPEMERFLGDWKLQNEVAATDDYQLWRTKEGQLVVKLPEQIAADPDRSLAFVQSAEAFAAVAHPGVARVLDSMTEGDTAFVVLDLPSGETLAKLELAEPSNAAIARICVDVLDALEAAHAQDAAFGNLGPDTILISDDGQVVLVPTCTAARSATAANDLEALGEIAKRALPPGDGELGERLRRLAIVAPQSELSRLVRRCREAPSAPRAPRPSEPDAGFTPFEAPTPVCVPAALAPVEPAPQRLLPLGDRVTPIVAAPKDTAELDSAWSDTAEPPPARAPPPPPRRPRREPIRAPKPPVLALQRQPSPPRAAVETPKQGTPLVAPEISRQSAPPPLLLTVPLRRTKTPALAASVVIREPEIAPLAEAPAEVTATTDRPVARTYAPEPDEPAPLPKRRSGAGAMVVLSVLLGAALLLGVALWPKASEELASDAPELTAPPRIAPAAPAPAKTMVAASPDPAPGEAQPVAVDEPAPARQKAATRRSARTPEASARKPEAPPATAQPPVSVAPRYRIDDLKPLPQRK